MSEPEKKGGQNFGPNETNKVLTCFLFEFQLSIHTEKSTLAFFPVFSSLSLSVSLPPSMSVCLYVCLSVSLSLPLFLEKKCFLAYQNLQWPVVCTPELHWAYFGRPHNWYIAHCQEVRNKKKRVNKGGGDFACLLKRKLTSNSATQSYLYSRI